MNKKERFVITTSPEHMDTLTAAKRAGRGELNELLANERNIGYTLVNKDNKVLEYYPSIGNYTIKRVVNGDFAPYKFAQDALVVASDLHHDYKKLNQARKQHLADMNKVSEQNKGFYPCPECGNSIECLLPNKADEVWDTMVACHFCGNMHFRTITREGYDIREIPDFIDNE